MFGNYVFLPIIEPAKCLLIDMWCFFHPLLLLLLLLQLAGKK
jgi:hypothetical protein